MTAEVDEKKEISEETDAPVRSKPKVDPSTVEWILWKHNCGQQHQSEEEWKQSTAEMSHFFAHPSEKAFHMDLDHLPLPSKSFFLKTTVVHEEHKAPGQHTEYSLFKRGISPEWEDPQCKGELYAKHFFPPSLLDKYWQQMAHGVMEGAIDCTHVCGIRIVDKSKGKHPVYRLELWLDTLDPHIRGAIRKQAMNCIEQDEHYLFKLHWREFVLDEANGKQHPKPHKNGNKKNANKPKKQESAPAEPAPAVAEETKQ